MSCFSWQRVDCPKCGARVGMKCRTLTSGRITDSHNARIDAAFTKTTDQQIVQEYADQGRLNELPPGVYVVPEPIVLPDT